MIHPHTQLAFINEVIGYGVVATQFIPKGTIAWVLDDLDQKFDKAFVDACPPLLRENLLKYCYRDSDGQYILCWDIAKFVNHSFNSSLIATPFKFELAARDIYPGEELTDDYGYLNLDKPFYGVPEPGCSRVRAMPDDILHFYPEWDRKAAEAMQYFNQVEQPLKSLLQPQYLEKVKLIADGLAPMDSILTCYCDRSQHCKAAKTSV